MQEMIAPPTGGAIPLPDKRILTAMGIPSQHREHKGSNIGKLQYL